MGHEHIRPTRTGAWGITVPTGMAKMEIQSEEFATHASFKRKSFGAHQIQSLGDSDLAKFLKYCPEADFMING